MFRILVALLLSVVSVGACARSPVVIPDTCSLPLPPGQTVTRAAGTTIGNYDVYIRNNNQNKRFYLPSTTFDLHGRVEQGDLGTVLPAAERSKLIGTLYTFEQPDTAQAVDDAPTYPAWYFVPYTIGYPGTTVRYEAEVQRFTYQPG